MNIYEKLQEARVKLQESNLKKTGKNVFANFEYFELRDFIPTLNNIFKDLKLFSKFDLKTDCATLEIINVENLEEKIIFETPVVNANVQKANVIQELGATHTYLKRYLYLNALEIVEDDVTDKVNSLRNQNYNEQQRKTQEYNTKKEISKKEKGIKYITKQIETRGTKIENVVNEYLKEIGAKNIKYLNEEKIITLSAKIKNEILKLEEEEKQIEQNLFKKGENNNE